MGRQNRNLNPGAPGPGSGPPPSKTAIINPVIQAAIDRPLSVVMPCYNEAATIQPILQRVRAVPVVREIIVVDDGSTDGTRELLQRSLADWPPAAPALRVFFQPRNRGKGAALREGFRHATAPFTIVQDADLEYDPRDYPKLVQPLLDGAADVVYGSRFAGFPRRVLYFWHSLGNRLLTLLSNMATDLNLTDMETCYKVFRTDVLQSIPLRSDRFGFEPEITAKIARLGCRIYEVPIAYHGRTYAEGKKIGWKDGLQALWTILKYACVDDVGIGTGELTLRLLRRADKYNRWVYELIKPYIGRRILEVGAGIGNMTRHYLSHGEVTATDISPWSLGELRKAFADFPQVRVERLDITRDACAQTEAYDTILCLNVLEHIEDDVQSLRHMRTLLKPGGRLVLYVPSNPRLYCEIDRGVGHFRRYEEAELRRKLVEAGFRLGPVTSHNSIGALGWWLQGKILGKRRIGSSDVGGMNALMPFIRLQERLDLRSRFALSILAVGERP
jgi:glycosyltransferase involved in cell wall biosynthesis